MITIQPRTTRTTLSSTKALVVGGDSYVFVLGAHTFFKEIHDCEPSKEICENGGKKFQCLLENF